MREIKFRGLTLKDKSIPGSKSFWVTGEAHIKCKRPHIHTDIGVSGYVYPTEKLAEQLFAYELKDTITVHPTMSIDNDEDLYTIEGSEQNPIIIYFFHFSNLGII